MDDLDADLARRMAFHFAGLSTAFEELADQLDEQREAAMRLHPSSLRAVPPWTP